MGKGKQQKEKTMFQVDYTVVAYGIGTIHGRLGGYKTIAGAKQAATKNLNKRFGSDWTYRQLIVSRE